VEAATGEVRVATASQELLELCEGGAKVYRASEGVSHIARGLFEEKTRGTKMEEARGSPRSK
jgi:hypothetical protein